MPQEVKRNAEERMEKAVAALRKDLAGLRAGRASVALLEKVEAEYYGTMMPITQMASVTTPDLRTLVIQPWDKSALAAIEKAIIKSDLGVTPTNDGSVIRITLPPLTEERRQELVKLVRKFGEEAKVAIRNIRRDANDQIRKMEKKEISEDESRRYQEEIQKLTDKYVAEVDKALAAKEKEILEI